MNRVPKSLVPFLETYVSALKEIFSTELKGVYLYGSIALNAFDLKVSDIDFITVLGVAPNKEQLEQLHQLQKRLNKNGLGKRMDGVYITVDGLGKTNRELPPYPYCSDGKIHEGHWDINAVTWWILEKHGIKLHGQEILELPFETSWAGIVDNMKYNINSYWYGKSKSTVTFLSNEMVEFCVLTLCRIICCLKYKDIFAKAPSVEKALQILPDRWHLLLQEGLRIRERDKSKSLYSSRWARAKECREFIVFVHNWCNEILK